MPGADDHALRDRIAALLVEARHERALADDSGQLRTYWRIGDGLFRHLDGRPVAGYGQQVIVNLIKDIHLGKTSLYEILLLRRLLTAFHARTNLSWSHYRALIHLPGASQFRDYELQGRRRCGPRAS